MNTLFIRAYEVHDKAAAMLALIAANRRQDDDPVYRFEIDPVMFRVIPQSPFAYWASPGLLNKFKVFPSLETDDRHAAAGASTKDNFRFVRAWWEVIEPVGSVLDERSGWVPLGKGGSHGRFYADVHLLIRWVGDGKELKTFTGTWREAKGWGNHWRAELHNSGYYGRPGITWPSRSQVGFGARALPAGGLFGDKGPTVFIEDDPTHSLEVLSAIMNSEAFSYLVSLQMAFGSYEAGVIQRTPVPRLAPQNEKDLASLARGGWSRKRSLDTNTETSHAFILPALLQVEGRTLAARADAWIAQVYTVNTELADIQREIDDFCFDLYGIDEADRKSITQGFDPSPDGQEEVVLSEDEEGGTDPTTDPTSLVAELVSWAVGVAFGRFDVRVAGEGAVAVETEPFDPLPLCSAGMLVDDDGLPANVAPAGYPVEPAPVLVVDPGHRLDASNRVRAVVDLVFGVDADRWWSEIGAALSAKGGEVGTWLRKEFFNYHLKAYSKSRRKAPIWWPIGTPSGSYQVWLYAHRVTSDTLFQVLNDVVAPKVTMEEQQLTRLRQDAGPDPTASQRKIIDKQEGFLAELHELQEAITAVAPLWAPDLNDGIVIVLAPLWELFAHHRAWSRELKKHWGKLVKGEYDWTQLAMHLWPERVIPKCAEDRSLAIAHGLEEVFWCQDDTNDDKWRPREHPTTTVDELVAKRRNPAVAAALNHLANV